MTSKISFSDQSLEAVGFQSSWRTQKDKLREDFQCQTDSSLYDFLDRETQSGLTTQFIQDEVSGSTLSKVRKAGKNETLLDHFAVHHNEFDEEYWRTAIQNGKITVDYEVCRDPSTKVEKENFLECVLMKNDVGTQTKSSYKTRKEKNSKDSDVADFVDQMIDYSNLNSFLRKVLPLVEEELDSNAQSKAFDGYEISTVDGADEVSYWRTLTVDLEKRKVVFPDWSNARHYKGRIVNCILTRNKERLYDIDYEDGARLHGVREEHIRSFDNGDSGEARSAQLMVGAGKKSSAAIAEEKALKAQEKRVRLQEGVRVHARVVMKGGKAMYIPGRITKCGKAGGTYDVECEGSSRCEVGLTLDDLLLGLEDGYEVEARRPQRVHLQCTGVSWNATGSTVAVSFGKYGIAGWCDFPGAVCLWNIFSKSFDASNPEIVLDHSSCIMCVRCHPTAPAVLVAGSFNGEVIVWDLSLPEQVLAVSPISEYSHKEPVLDVDWVYNNNVGEWLVSSVGADGKVLFWSLTNKLLKPFTGSSLIAGKKGGNANTSSSSTSTGPSGGGSTRRAYPGNYGGTSISFAGNSGGSGSGGSGSAASSILTSWFVVGQEGGSIVRGQTAQLLSSSKDGSGSDKGSNQDGGDGKYPPIRRVGDRFSHEPHIGAVNSLDCSPFNKYLFLSGGADGSLRLFHMLQRQPLRQWDPVPPPGAAGSSGTFSAITGVRFSPVRPSLFAAASAEGFLYIFDLSVSASAPITVLEAPTGAGSANNGDGSSSTSLSSSSKLLAGSSPTLMKPTQAAGSRGAGGVNSAQSGAANNRRVGITGIAFNRKQRDLIAACDYSGRVHIWRLGWSLSNRHPAELKIMEDLGSTIATDDAA